MSNTEPVAGRSQPSGRSDDSQDQAEVMSERPFRGGPGSVTVIIATRNRRVLLEEALRSLFAQDLSPERYEIVVVDDGSNDGAGQSLRKLAVESPVALRYIRLQGRGAPAARNLGMRLARGQIVAHTDDDARLPPGWLRAASRLFAPGVGIVSGPILPKPEQPQRFFSWCPRLEREDGVYPTSNIFYLRQAALAAGGFAEADNRNLLGRPRWGWDAELAWSLREAGYATRFDASVVAYHHVWDQGLVRWLGEAWRAHMLPEVVRRLPQLRQTLLWRRFFYHRNHLYFDFALLGVGLAAAWNPYGLALAAPWLLKSLADVRVHLWPPRQWPRAGAKMALTSLQHGVRLAGLLYGSLLARRLVI